MTRSLTATACVSAALFLACGFWIAAKLSLTSPAASIALPPPTDSTGFSKPPLWVDLNHDSLLDSVAVVSDGHGGHTIQIKLDGVGSRELRCDDRCASRTIVYAADVNRDANLDLVRESEDGFEPVIVWLGDGKGNFVLSAAPIPIPVDFYALPPAPYCPSSSSRSQSTSCVAFTAAEKRERSGLLKPDTSGNQKAVTESRKRPLRRDSSARIHRELLLWIARTINPPPASSPFA